MALGLELHLLDQAAVPLLHTGALFQGAAGLGEPLGQVVAQLLELADRHQPRAAP